MKGIRRSKGIRKREIRRRRGIRERKKTIRRKDKTRRRRANKRRKKKKKRSPSRRESHKQVLDENKRKIRPDYQLIRNKVDEKSNARLELSLCSIFVNSFLNKIRLI